VTALQRRSPADFRSLVDSERREGSPVLDGEAAAPIAEWFELPVDAETVVRRILDEVREEGDDAVRRWSERLDGTAPASSRVPAAALEAAWSATPPALQEALRAAAERIREVHAAQRDATVRGIASAHLVPRALRRAGCYIPGGRAAYPSTVLMNVIPAQLAGVGSIAITSPPGPAGGVHRHVAAAAHLLGVTEVHAVGGAQAVAALAYGTVAIARADVITGPGNVFVTLAKRLVAGDVRIDGVAGPSEILVIATDGADPLCVAADLVSQLEHDPLAWAVCVTDSASLAEAVGAAFESESAGAVRSGIIAGAAGRHGVIVVCDSLDECVDVADFFAAEHLSLQGAAAEALRDRDHTAGAVFCGRLSPVSMGDYIAGPNHTLPTGGAARYRGPLSVMDFVRWPSVVDLSAAEFAALSPSACALAEAEGLAGHERAIRLRMESPA
jgi:histidinol dehydrogenase